MENMNYQERSLSFPLALAGEGEVVRITSIRCGRKIQERLLSMGIRLNDIIEVVCQQGQGSLLISHGNSRYAFGAGMAHKIQVIKEV